MGEEIVIEMPPKYRVSQKRRLFLKIKKIFLIYSVMIRKAKKGEIFRQSGVFYGKPCIYVEVCENMLYQDKEKSK